MTGDAKKNRLLTCIFFRVLAIQPEEVVFERTKKKPVKVVVVCGEYCVNLFNY